MNILDELKQKARKYPEEQRFGYEMAIEDVRKKIQERVKELIIEGEAENEGELYELDRLAGEEK